MIKLVAFDWNGTLLADTQLSLDADNEVFRALKIKKVLRLWDLQHHFVIPISQYWVNLGFSPNFFKKNSERIAKIFFGYYNQYDNSCRTRSGVRQVLLWLKRNKTRTVIFSNHGMADIEKQLHRLKIFGFFDKVMGRELGSNSHLHSRSKERLLKVYVQKHDFKPSEVLVVGDTTEEIEIAKEYGYYSVAITGGQQTLAKLKSFKPDYIIGNLINLKKIIKII